MHGWVVRVALMGLISAFVTAVPGVVPAQAVDETETVDIPRAVRWDPRRAGVVGESSAGVVYIREGEPTSATLPGRGEIYLRGADGTETPLDGPAARVYGDRLVTWWNSAEVHSRRLPDGPLEATRVPDGYRLITVTGDGVLLSAVPSGDDPLALLPWDGGAPLQITGLPSGRIVDTLAGLPVADEQGAVIYTTWSGGQQSESVYVDTATRRAWPLGLTGRDWGLGDDTIAWPTTGPDDERLISTMPRPTESTPTPAVSTRAMPVTPGWDQSSHVSLLPVDDDVVVWVGGSLGWSQHPSESARPVVAVGPDGLSRDLLGWGHDVRPATTPGQVVLVGGEDSTTPAVRRIDVATGASTVVAPLEPFPAWATQIAVDDGGVAYVDMREKAGAFLERSVGLDLDGAALELGAEKPVGSPVEPYSCWNYPEKRCANVVAGDGSLAWVEDFVSTLVKWGVREADGTTRTGVVPTFVNAEGITTVSGPWLMLDRAFLVDTRTGAATKVIDYGHADLLDGVVHLPGSVTETTPQGSVIMRSPDDGTVAALPVPGCQKALSVQAAGSWLLVSCTTGDGGARFAVDRTGQTPTWSLESGAYYLGNGFVVRRDEDDLLSWTPLAGGSAEWRDLGAAGYHWATASVSRGAVPNVAWIDPAGQAHVKRLPVATSPLPARPTARLSPPGAPRTTADPSDRRVTVTWAPADPAEEVTGYVVRRQGDRAVQVLGPEETSATFRGLANGSTYTFSVTAQNIAGEITSTVDATPLGPPTAPENIEVVVDERTSSARVTWTWWQAPATEPVTSFDLWVGAGPTLVRDLPASARSATITVPWPTTDPVTVVARGEHGWRSADSAPMTFPGVDDTAPTVVAPAVPRVLRTTRIAVPLEARDDRELASVDLRWRRAASGKPLGSWVYPSAWQRREPGRVDVGRLRRGHTYCFSSRARDAAGNLSRWTPQRCTVVALDDRALARSGSWKLPTGRRFYLGTASSTSARNSTLSRDGARARAGYLMATTCPACGRVRVQIGSIEVGTVRLRSSVRRHQRVIAIPWPMRLQGRLVLRPVPGSGPVTIDGIALRSY